jgi:MYXO-CTERM domain-containing protein
MTMLAALLAGCSNDDDVDFESEEPEESILDGYPPIELSPGNVAAFAGASAPNIFGIGIALLAAPNLANDPNCPKVTETAIETVYEGGCTTMQGNQVVGKASVRETADGDATIEYVGWGMGNTETCNGAMVDTLATYTGTMHIDKTATGAASFDLEIEINAEGPDENSCAIYSATAGYDYAGSFVGGENAQGGFDLNSASTWNGSGQVGSSVLGKFNTKTADELVDRSACETEAISGTTTLSSGSDTAVITYDGATDCEMTSTVRWSLNGVDQGELTDVQCSVSRVGHDPRGLFALFAAGLVVAGLARRRR